MGLVGFWKAGSLRSTTTWVVSDTTKIIIAQRVTSVMDADLIVVMDQGRIVAQGKHETLIKTCEIYREVFASQQEGVSIGG